MDPIILAMARGKYYTEFMLEMLKGKNMKDAEEKARAEAAADQYFCNGISATFVTNMREAFIEGHIDGALAERDQLLSHEEAKLLVESNTQLERENIQLKNELENLKKLYKCAITKLGKIEDIMEDK